tara:strand:+ start:13107 stop:14075 length:969 start_codon:yes stop_codon:yes gene_type:complete
MVELSFINQSYLWLLTLIPFIIAIHFFTLKYARTAIIKFSNFEAIQRVASGDVLGKPYHGILRNKNMGLLLLRAIVYILLILSVAGTTLHYEGKASKFDFVLAMDTSSSMLADDFQPSRLEAAKEAAIKFVDIVPTSTELGIVTFASTSLSNLRLTSDKAVMEDTISKIELIKSGGTAIGDALISATNLFNSKPSKKAKAIILLTDGQSNVGMDPLSATAYAKDNTVTIHAIGVATHEGGTVSNIELFSRLDEDLLSQIADSTNGKFFVVESIEKLESAFKEIAASEDSIVSNNISWILLLAAIAILGLEWIFINTIYKTIP